MVLGFIMYCSIPYMGNTGNIVGFVLCFLLIISMYGGGFATVPAYLRDMFGTRYVGAIHGLLITAWSMAGIFGPVLVNYIRQYNIDHGVPKAQAYNVTMYIMAGLFIIGFIANALDESGRCALPHEAREQRRSGSGDEGRCGSQAGRRIREDQSWPNSNQQTGTTALQLALAVVVRRHPTDLGCDPDAHQRDEAVSVTCKPKQNAAPQQEAAPFLFRTRRAKRARTTPPFPSGAGTWRGALPGPSRS